MRWNDTKTGYGWLSIALHWITAIIVLVMLIVGTSIPGSSGAAYENMLRLHTSIAVLAYILLVARIVWRVKRGHPGPLPKQRGAFFQMGKYTHYLLIAAIGGMLISGPLMAWSGGYPVHVLHWFTIPSPIPVDGGFFNLMHQVHIACATVIGIGVLAHVAGAVKHLVVNKDGTLDKMLVAAAPDDETTPAG